MGKYESSKPSLFAECRHGRSDRSVHLSSRFQLYLEALVFTHVHDDVIKIGMAAFILYAPQELHA